MKQKIVTSESTQSLIAAGKSSRLDAIRQKVGGQIATADLATKNKTHTFVPGLNQQTKEALQQATIMVEQSISSILNTYPEGKKNTFFNIKYGISVAKLKQMLIKDIFKRLEMDQQQVKNFQLIENLSLSGKAANAK